MNTEELHQLVQEIQRRQAELENVEVKGARHGTPKRIYEVLSAFANHSGGGIVLFGLDEQTDFSVTGVGDAHRLQEEITHTCNDGLEPALRPRFTVDEIEGEVVVAVEVGEIPAPQKPCFYKTAGLPKGAYIRVGNTNRQMSEYEVFGYLSGRGQPREDEEVALQADPSDLDDAALETFLEAGEPRAARLQGPPLLLPAHVP